MTDQEKKELMKEVTNSVFNCAELGTLGTLMFGGYDKTKNDQKISYKLTVTTAALLYMMILVETIEDELGDDKPELRKGFDYLIDAINDLYEENKIAAQTCATASVYKFKKTLKEMFGDLPNEPDPEDKKE